MFCGGRIKVIGPTKNEMLKVATKIEHSNQVTEHAGYKYVGNIIDVQDKYQPDLSDSNKASIIMVVEFENKNFFLQVTVHLKILLKPLINIIQGMSLKW